MTIQSSLDATDSLRPNYLDFALRASPLVGTGLELGGRVIEHRAVLQSLTDRARAIVENINSVRANTDLAIEEALYTERSTISRVRARSAGRGFNPDVGTARALTDETTRRRRREIDTAEEARQVSERTAQRELSSLQSARQSQLNASALGIASDAFKFLARRRD